MSVYHGYEWFLGVYPNGNHTHPVGNQPPLWVTILLSLVTKCVVEVFVVLPVPQLVSLDRIAIGIVLLLRHADYVSSG